MNGGYSICGYDTAARQSRDRRGSQNPLKWTRHTDYEFRGCLAHADVTWNLSSSQVERVIGHFDHCADCTAAPVIHQYINKLTLSLARSEHNGFDSGVGFEHGARRLVTATLRQLILNKRSTSQTGSPQGQCLSKGSAYSTGELSESPSETPTCFDRPDDGQGYVRYL